MIEKGDQASMTDSPADPVTMGPTSGANDGLLKVEEAPQGPTPKRRGAGTGPP